MIGADWRLPCTRQNVICIEVENTSHRREESSTWTLEIVHPSADRLPHDSHRVAEFGLAPSTRSKLIVEPFSKRQILDHRQRIATVMMLLLVAANIRIDVRLSS